MEMDHIKDLEVFNSSIGFQDVAEHEAIMSSSSILIPNESLWYELYVFAVHPTVLFKVTPY